MARKPDIQYIQYYTDGSAARKLEMPLPRRKKSTLPKVNRKKEKVLKLDPLALGGIVVSAIMLVLMLVGSIYLYRLDQQTAQMQVYIDQLTEQNTELTDTYANGYDLEEVEHTALALGMIPVEEAKTVTIRVPRETAVEIPSAWDNFCAFLAGIFA